DPTVQPSSPAAVSCECRGLPPAAALTPALLQQQQGKRPRTRITDDQLRVLRQYFDINNSPNEEQIKEMADKSGLPQKVIKHWFRNTLFKERQHIKVETTITPEQLEVLYQKYLLDSNPTRNMLDHIAREVGLKKRVVQVWFQNTRARERKGQFRALGPAQAHRRCPEAVPIHQFPQLLPPQLPQKTQ
uniref:Homeobox domain-containing protein n=1 Tax=Denticeps clupeoides TaxID=299321 RepID=A0AAY4BMF9_9TELE